MASGGFNMNVRSDIKEAEKMLTTAQKKVIPQATARSLNRTAQKVRTEARRGVARQMGIKQKVIKKQIEIIVKAKRYRLHAVVEATGRHINMIEFVSPSKRYPGAFRKKKGVTARAYGKRKQYKGTFIGRGKGSGKPLVFVREGASRLPIRSVYGPSVPKTFIQKHIIAAMRKEAVSRWKKEFDQNLRYYLQRAGYKVK